MTTEPVIYHCPEPECSFATTDGAELYRHTGKHIDAEWDAIKDQVLPDFRAGVLREPES